MIFFIASSEPSGASSQQREVGKPISRGPSLKKIEVGPLAAKRHVGKQKPKVIDDSQGGSFRKKVVVSHPQQKEDFIGWLENKELNLMNRKSLNPNLLHLHVRVVSKIQKVKSRN